MNEQEIKKVIRNIANEEVSDQIDLLPRIQAAIQKSESKTINQWHPFVKPVLALCAFFLFTAATYFFYKNLNQDQSIPAQWVTEIDQSEQAGDLTVTLDWAYLDAARASVGILTIYPAESETAYRLNEAYLLTNDGEELPALMNSGGGGGGGNAADTERRTGTHINFDSSLIELDSQSLPLTLELSYEPISHDDQVLTAADYQFRFDFSLPYFAAVAGEVKNTHLEKNGMWFEISEVTVTPSMTRFTLCYEKPDENSNWIPLVFVDSGYMESLPIQEQQPDWLTDGKMGYRAHMASAPVVDGNKTCANMSASAPYNGETDLVITVDSMTLDEVSYTDEYIAAEKAYFVEQGFLLEAQRYDFGQEMSGSMIVKVISEDQFIGIQVMDYPDNMTAAQAQNYIGTRIFKQRINGPWQFVVTTEK
jgi:hypothetical protein